jgi:ferritin-like metal-binding protein YciE
MSRKIANLKDLFLERARELHDTSHLEQKELVSIKVKCSNEQLTEIIDREIYSAKNQAQTLVEIFNDIKEKHEGTKDLCSRAILEETKNLISKSNDQKVKDAAIIDSIKRLNHHNIASLGSLAAFAMELGMRSHSISLQSLLKEEKIIDKQLSELAMTQVNKEAAIAV